MVRVLFRVAIFGIAALSLAGSAPAGTPLGNGFTYQGELRQSGQPFTGLANIQFDLYDAASNGTFIGTQTVNNVNVVSGLFTVVLNGGNQFGASAFNGENRWLQITVNGTPLSPRQALTATPYALYAANSPGSGLWATTGTTTYNTADTFVGINRTNVITSNEYFGVRAPVGSGVFGGMYVETTNASGLPFYGYAANGSAQGYHWIDGATGTWKLYNGGTHLVVQSDGSVGVGTTSPGAKLEVVAGSSGDGIHTSTTAAFGYGVYATGISAGVYGQSGTSDGAGVYGRDDTNGASGVEGHTTGNGAGVAGYGNNGTGVYGQTDSGWGVYGSVGGSGYAGYFNGKTHINGTLSKNAGSFRIDHPLDPANKYLNHSFVESPDMMNVYNGNVVLDDQGQATVQLPDWFDALNRDFRYQLTCIGGYAPIYIAQEIGDNQFTIAGGTPDLKVSWQVTGVRQDPYAEAHRIPVEEPKVGAERGKYLHPELYGQPADLQLYPPPRMRPTAPAQPASEVTE